MGVNTTPPNDSPVEARERAMERLRPGNQRVTKVVAMTMETPVLPMPNSTNRPCSCHSSRAWPSSAKAMPAMAAPTIMMRRTSTWSISRATPMPAMPPARK